MPSRSISVRLDADAAAALQALENAGSSRSEAIRAALVAAAGRQEERGALVREVAELAEDEADRREKAAIGALLDELSDAW
ncbi:MAG: ribbon-helix-helix protein, CopG family [Gaiellaceae bacterium]